MPTEFKDKHGNLFTVRDKPSGETINLIKDKKGYPIYSGTWAAAIKRKIEWHSHPGTDGTMQMVPIRSSPRERIGLRQHIERHVYVTKIEELQQDGLNISQACRAIAAAEMQGQALPPGYDATHAIESNAASIRNIYYNAKRSKPT